MSSIRSHRAVTTMCPIVNNSLSGAVAGLGATAPMTATILAVHRSLPVHEQHAIPPRQITMEAAEVLDVDSSLGEFERTCLTAASHFGYGAAMGTIYGALLGSCPAPPVAKGVGFGLGVWAASYLGWLPAANSKASAERQSGNRNAMMIAAHVVWGIGLGLLCDRLRKRRFASPPSQKPRG